MEYQSVTIIGGGLAGSEAAWQMAESGIRVHLYEMRPHQKTPAHQTDFLAELVCSNSFKSIEPSKASGLLKQEMTQMGSLILESAQKSKVPAGKALAVDRTLFSQYITQKISSHPKIQVLREECTEIPKQGIVILATGPLTSLALSQSIQEKLGENSLYFYDAISPIVTTESIDMNFCFEASRYEAGSDYLNIPLSKEQYTEFVQDLMTGEKIEPKDFEKAAYFEGCLPIEVMAQRGFQTLAFGPLKPVGLTDPRSSAKPYAVIQLRKENQSGTLYNLVGFQTKLTYSEQKRIFQKILALKKAVFVRLGSIHRNTFIHSPLHLNPYLQLKSEPRIFFAGQITGVEGYMESTAMGLLVGRYASQFVKDKPIIPIPETTAMGVLIHYITSYPHKNYQPMNINYGLFPPLHEKTPKRDKKEALWLRANKDLSNWIHL
ncbi:MAG: methylenetetrahydrofolate--tRNA-(uracil(54)-C(5))-methyltransferase (FADH(2)-oxidizing) TrmFO [Deltaproteobacteria bacterium RIFCSPHIGHO2_02_FULL_40_11]|nr:MAG: methylenetetrahydrofolate--tRNA-(uracil(54)-C(5))-methyltransferase (FADH(2)-oxidizing) TrmFO [Deltaproteobacteria bacterium RIFCSPHIGHO2_02_FULL_40_11]